MCRIPNDFKIQFSPKIYFFKLIFINKYLKFKETECLIMYVWNVSSFILCKFPLFSTAKTQISPDSLNSWEIRIFEFPLLSYFIEF